MKPSDYKCFACGRITEIWVQKLFPQSIKCPQCQNDARRMFSPIYSIIHQGKVGNSNNGYTTNLGKVKKT